MADTLAVGKLDMEFLAALLEQYTRIDDERVVVGPRVGEDALVIDFGTISWWPKLTPSPSLLMRSAGMPST